MRRMFQIIGIIGVVAALGLAAGWFACAGWRTVATSYVDTTSTALPISEIRVSGGSVWVEVRTSNEPGVQVERTARYLNPFHGRPAPTHRIDGSILELGADSACSFCAFEYVVRAPAGVKVSADVGTGALDLAGVSTVDAAVSTGSVAVTDATGDVTAHVGTGAISLELAAPANVEATTSTGSVDVRVPAGSYRVDASTKLGKVVQGIPNDPAGRYQLALRAGTGQVTLAAS